MSSAVAVTSDATPPLEQAHQEEHEHLHKSISDANKHQSAVSPTNPQATPHRFVSLRQINALAAITVLAASGMVSASDIAFSILSFIYLLFLSYTAFPAPSTLSVPPPVFGDRNRLLGLYISAGALIGLVIPVAYILEGVFEGDKEGIKAAAPHVYLLACQIFMEGITFSRRYSLPIRAFVPILYNSRRLFTIADWLRDEVGKAGEVHHGSAVRVAVGRGLALTNMAFWGFNLFGFLIPVYLPRVLNSHHHQHHH